MKNKYKCSICKDTGYFINPFDQKFKCDCKKKKYPKADYRGFILHIWEWNKIGIPVGISDMKELAKKYNCPIPKDIR